MESITDDDERIEQHQQNQIILNAKKRIVMKKKSYEINRNKQDLHN